MRRKADETGFKTLSATIPVGGLVSLTDLTDYRMSFYIFNDGSFVCHVF
jgi:hypothetical protein